MDALKRLHMFKQLILANIGHFEKYIYVDLGILYFMQYYMSNTIWLGNWKFLLL